MNNSYDKVNIELTNRCFSTRIPNQSDDIIFASYIHTKKDGSPDLRYSDNALYYLICFGKFDISIDGLSKNTSFYVNGRDNSKELYELLINMIDCAKENKEYVSLILNNDDSVSTKMKAQKFLGSVQTIRDIIEQEEYDKYLLEQKKLEEEANKGKTEYQIRREKELEVLRRIEKLK